MLKCFKNQKLLHKASLTSVKNIQSTKPKPNKGIGHVDDTKPTSEFPEANPVKCTHKVFSSVVNGTTENIIPMEQDVSQFSQAATKSKKFMYHYDT